MASRPQSATASSAPAATPGSQTLTRGLRALEILADAEGPISITELASRLDVHRSNAYRILRSLEERRFVVRDEAGLIRLGPKLTVLARGVAPALHTAASQAITDLAFSLGMTAFMGVLDADEVVTLLTSEPANVDATISRNPGIRHRVDRGALGHAIESSFSAEEREAFLGSPDFSPEALVVKERGYATSNNEVIDGITAVAVPLRIPGEPPAAVGVVHFTLPGSLKAVVARMNVAAAQIVAAYR